MKIPAVILFGYFCSISLLPAAEPIVRMLVPGFTVQEVPVRLSNINNLRFAPDGRLTALAYDGRIYLLRDSNGDGIEDEVQVFWDKPTISVPVGMVWSSDGLYVSSKGKVSLIRDTDHDGRGDTEEVIASGWPPTDVGSGGVDATAVTIDPQGNLYFGLLVADYSNAYRIKDGVSHYDIHSPRGTIQKWNHATKKLETIATGIRVPYTLAFNSGGDLFVTDQEGETWMPHGNPLDELNQIIPGRNYGFPPRHEKWLPDLISEPPVVAFGPQHQSTCGLVFNEAQPRTASSPGRKTFGPEWWSGDAFVTGESRGKLWRVRLAKTPYGYVGKEHLIARLSMLTMDATLSPKGELYVSCHSGPPDWGTGPQGEGKLFKITYTDTSAPQPLMAWQANMMEARLAFDRSVAPDITNHWREMVLEGGAYVSAADRFEVLKPPYAVVNKQEATSRRRISITGARLDEKNTVLVLETGTPLREVARYALTVPGVRAAGSEHPPSTVDVQFDTCGAELVLRARAGLERLPVVGEKVGQAARQAGIKTARPSVIYDGWLPTPDLAVAKELTRPYKPIADAFDLLSNGSQEYLRISFLVPTQAMTLHAFGSAAFKLGCLDATDGGNHVMLAEKQSNGTFAAHLPLGSQKPTADSGRLYEIEISGTPPSAPRMPIVSLAYSTPEDPTLRPIFPSRTFLEGAYHDKSPSPETPKTDFEIGDWQQGKSLFFGEQLHCATCHKIRGDGGSIGPDLSNLTHRDAASVLRDIREPSAAINPDYVTYNATTANGDSFTGFVTAHEDQAIRLMGADGKEMVLKRADLREFRPSGISLMPSGLLDGMKPNDLRDLLTFLLYEPPKRTMADLHQALAAAKTSATFSSQTAAAEKQRPLTLVLIASQQDHGPGEHDYPAWQKKWQRLLSTQAGVKVETAWEWPDQDQFDRADALIFYCWNHDWSAARFKQLDAFQSRGGGVAVFHAATIADHDKDTEQLAERIGLAAQPGRSAYRHCPFDLQLASSEANPILAGLPATLPLIDEPYWPMIGDASKITVLASVTMENKRQPMIWTFQHGNGRVFASIAGHYVWTLDDPLFRLIALRGIAWAAKTDLNRFEPVAEIEITGEAAK